MEDLAAGVQGHDRQRHADRLRKLLEIAGARNPRGCRSEPRGGRSGSAACQPIGPGARRWPSRRTAPVGRANFLGEAGRFGRLRAVGDRRADLTAMPSSSTASRRAGIYNAGCISRPRRISARPIQWRRPARIAATGPTALSPHRSTLRRRDLASRGARPVGPCLQGHCWTGQRWRPVASLACSFELKFAYRPIRCPIILLASFRVAGWAMPRHKPRQAQPDLRRSSGPAVEFELSAPAQLFPQRAIVAMPGAATSLNRGSARCTRADRRLQGTQHSAVDHHRRIRPGPGHHRIHLVGRIHHRTIGQRVRD